MQFAVCSRSRYGAREAMMVGCKLLGSARLSRRFAFLAPRGCKQVEPGGTRQVVSLQLWWLISLKDDDDKNISIYLNIYD